MKANYIYILCKAPPSFSGCGSLERRARPSIHLRGHASLPHSHSLQASAQGAGPWLQLCVGKHTMQVNTKGIISQDEHFLRALNSYLYPCSTAVHLRGWFLNCLAALSVVELGPNRELLGLICGRIRPFSDNNHYRTCNPDSDPDRVGSASFCRIRIEINSEHTCFFLSFSWKFQYAVHNIMTHLDTWKLSLHGPGRTAQRLSVDWCGPHISRLLRRLPS